MFRVYKSQLPGFRQFQNHLILWTEFKSSYFFCSNWFTIVDRTKRRREVSASISSIVFQTQFILSFPFFFFPGWFNSHVSMMWSVVRCEGRFFSDFAKRKLFGFGRVQIGYGFARALFPIWFTQRVNRRRSFLEHFCEVSRAVNLAACTWNWPCKRFGQFLLENEWREV